MSTPETPHDDDQPATGPTEPLSSGDPLQAGPEQPGEEQASPPPPPPPPRRLTRTAGDKVLGGVAGGLGRYFSIDPIIFRIAFVVLTLVGGAGVLGYLAAWLLVPSDAASGAPRTGTNRALTIVGGVVLAIAALAFLGPGLVFVGPPLLGLGLVALVGVLLWRAAGGQDGDANRAARRLGLGLLLLVVAGAGFVAVAVGAVVGGGAVIAGLVIAVGVALVVGAFLGGARWLVIPALVLAVPLGLVAAAGIDVEGGIGERDYRPTTVGELRGGYELGMGELSLDLRDLDFPAGRTELKVDLGIGDVRVLVPEDVCVASAARVGVGYIRVLDRENGGLDVDWRQSPAENAGVKRLVIDADLGVGALQVAHNRDAFDFSDGEHGPGRRFDSGFPFDDTNSLERNDACTESA